MAVPAAGSTAPRPTLDILVVAGQSNAVGAQSYVIDPKTHWNVFHDHGSRPADTHSLITWDESGVPGGACRPCRSTPPSG